VRNNYENFEFNLRQARNGIDEISCDYRTRTLVHNHMKNLPMFDVKEVCYSTFWLERKK
jgi:hypothetical protein